MKDLPVRKHPRLKGYDYNQNGAYFITFCVKDRHEILGRIVGRDALGAPFPADILGAPSIELSDYGEAVQREIEKTQECYDGVVVDKYVIMPNHVHMILLVNRDSVAPRGLSDNGAPRALSESVAPRASRPTNALIPSIVAIIKKKANKTAGFDMWQDSYHDHIIRDDGEYQRIWQYVDENPARWAEDEYHC